MAEKIALITGCSTGIGYYCAKHLHQRQGWRVFATARQEADIKKLQAEGMETIALNLDDSTSIKNAVGELLTKSNNKIDVLFNNAAFGQPGAVEDLSRQAIREQFETNVFGTQELTNQLIPIMRRQGAGRVIQNSSVLGFVALRYRGAYVASKYALEGFSDTLRLELHNTGVRVILIEPGPITSQFRHNATAKFYQHFTDEVIANSAHKDHYNQLKESGNAHPAVPFNLGPEAVYKAFLTACEAKNPAARYAVTVPSHVFWWLRRALPTRVLDSILRRF